VRSLIDALTDADLFGVGVLANRLVLALQVPGKTSAEAQAVRALALVCILPIVGESN